MSQKIKRFIGIVLITVFTFYYVNICFFYHTHIINGVTIVHSHIHTKDHAQTGTHTESELTLISALSAFQSGQPALFFAELGIFLLLTSLFLTAPAEEIVSQSIRYFSLRAPPVLS